REEVPGAAGLFARLPAAEELITFDLVETLSAHASPLPLAGEGTWGVERMRGRLFLQSFDIQSPLLARYRSARPTLSRKRERGSEFAERSHSIDSDPGLPP